jgi:hypothetical protein
MENYKMEIKLSEAMSLLANRKNFKNEELKFDLEKRFANNWSFANMGSLYRTRAIKPMDKFVQEMADRNPETIKKMFGQKEYKIPESIGMSYNLDNTGLFFDVGLVLSGEPECWVNQAPMPTRKPLTIKVEIAAQSTIDAKVLTEKYLEVINLYHSLLNEYTIRLVACYSGTCIATKPLGDVNPATGIRPTIYTEYLSEIEVEICGFGENIEVSDLLCIFNGVSYRALKFGILQPIQALQLGMAYDSSDFHKKLYDQLRNPRIVFDSEKGEMYIPPISANALKIYNIESLMQPILEANQ